MCFLSGWQEPGTCFFRDELRDNNRTIDRENIAKAVLRHLQETFQADAAILLRDDVDSTNSLNELAQTADFQLTEAPRLLAQQAFQQATMRTCQAVDDTAHRWLCVT